MFNILKMKLLFLSVTSVGIALAQNTEVYDTFLPNPPSAKESFYCSMGESNGCLPISKETLSHLDSCAEHSNIVGPLDSVGYLLLNRYADSVFFQELANRSHLTTTCQLSMLKADARKPLVNAGWKSYQTLLPVIDVLLEKRRAEESIISEKFSRPMTPREAMGDSRGASNIVQANEKRISDIDEAIDQLLVQLPFGGQKEVRSALAAAVRSSPSKDAFERAYDQALGSLESKYQEAEDTFNKIRDPKTGEYSLDFAHKTELYNGPGAKEFLSRVDPKGKSLKCRFDSCFKEGPRNARFAGHILLAGAAVMTLGSASPFLIAAASAGAMTMSAAAVQDSCFKDTINVTGEAVNTCSAETLANTTLSQMSKTQCAVDATLLALDAVPGLMVAKRLVAAKPDVGRAVASDISATVGRLGTGPNDVELLAKYGYKKKFVAPDGVAIYMKKGHPDIILPVKSSKLSPKGEIYKLSEEHKDHLSGILSGRVSENFIHPKVAKWKLEPVAGKIETSQLNQVEDALGKHWEDPKVREYFADELKDLKVLPPAQREKSFSLLVKRAEKWDSPMNAPYRLLAKARDVRYNKDLIRYRKSYLKENPGAKAEVAERFAVQSARARRDRVAKLGKQCRSLKPNLANKEAGKIFAKYSAVFGGAMTVTNYTLANLDLLSEDQPTFMKRLGFEFTATVVMSIIGSKIASNPSSSYMTKYVQNNLVSLGGNIPEAVAYQYFLNSTEEEARAKLEELQKSPTFEQDVKDLVAYLEDRSEIQKAVDKYDDKIKETLGLLTGNPDYTEKDLENLDKAVLQDPNVQEKLLDVIADDLYDETMDSTTTGSTGIDRLLYNTGWNAASNVVNVGISVGIFQAVCANLDNPAKAIAVFTGAQFARSTAFGYLYYKGRKESINQ